MIEMWRMLMTPSKEPRHPAPGRKSRTRAEICQDARGQRAKNFTARYKSRLNEVHRFIRLHGDDGCVVEDIVDGFKVSRSAVRKYLNSLLDAGRVRRVKRSNPGKTGWEYRYHAR